MAEAQRKPSNILEFNDGDVGGGAGAIEVFIAALCLDDSINVAQLTKVMRVLTEAQLTPAERLRVLRWIELIDRVGKAKQEILAGG